MMAEIWARPGDQQIKWEITWIHWQLFRALEYFFLCRKVARNASAVYRYAITVFCCLDIFQPLSKSNQLIVTAHGIRLFRREPFRDQLTTLQAIQGVQYAIPCSVSQCFDLCFLERNQHGFSVSLLLDKSCSSLQHVIDTRLRPLVLHALRQSLSLLRDSGYCQ